MATNKLFGPPGTGKTTTLLQMVSMHLKAGLSPDQICFISFTRKAAYEAKSRACEKFNLVDDQLPWFSTMHSLAFKSMGLSKVAVMGLGDYIKLCELLGLTITYKTISDDGTFSGQTLGDRLFFAESMARARMMTLQDYWETMPDEDISFHQLKQVSDTLAEYKRVNDKIDFIDIIYRFIESGDVPPCSVFILDEAQDLSPLQWKMVEKMMASIPECYIAGDDDQAIFRWAGSDVDHLIRLPGTQEVLGVSFRVPRKIQDVALNIVRRISHRVEKNWDARDDDGSVEHVTDIAHIDMSTGSWLLLARNNYLLDNYIQHCLREGYVFDCARESTMRRDTYFAIRDWEILRSGGQIPGTAVRKIYDLLTVRVGITYGYKGKMDKAPDRKMFTLAELRADWGLCVDTPWHQALDKLTPTEKTYFLAAAERGEKFTGNPRIKISTIHGAKGGEAENVVIQTDMAYRTHREMLASPDDEHRVWYVAVTRAKQNLFIVSPQSSIFYDI